MSSLDLGTVIRSCGRRKDKAKEPFRKLSAAAPQHPFALDLAAKSALFDEAAAKFAIAA